MKEKTEIIAGIIVIAVVALLFTMVQIKPDLTEKTQTTNKLDEILNRGTLVIATDPESAPFSELIPGSVKNSSSRCEPAAYSCDEFIGFDTAVGREIAKRLGVEPCFVTPIWTRIVNGNWADSWDISVGTMTITTERMEKLFFTQPYNSAPALVFVRQNDEQYKKPEDLSGKRIGVCAGCAQEKYLEGNLSLPGEKIRFKIHDAIPVAYNYETMAFSDLSSNSLQKLDAVISDAPIGMQSIYSGLPLRPLKEAVYYSYFAAAVDKKSSFDTTSFLTRVSDIIREMHEDGTLGTLARQYLIDDYTSEAKLFNISSIGQKK